MAVPLTFRLARYFTDVPSSVIAAGLVAFHPVLIRQAENIYTEAFYTPLLALIVLTIIWATRSPQIHRFLATGALLGILNLTRPTGIFLPALLPLIVPHAWSWRRRVGLSGVAVVAMLVIIAPWTYHNYQVHHTFLLFSVTSYALWQASSEYYHLMESGYNFWGVLYSHIFPVYYEGYDPYTIEGSRYFNERAFISIQSEPFVFLWFAVQKLLFFWIGHLMYPWDWPFNLAAVQNHWKTEWRIIGFYASRVYPIVTLLALLAMPQSFRHFRSLLIICVYFTVFHALTNAETRYSEPLHPLLAIIIATALARIAKQGWARLHGVNPLVRN